jgi:hypothetical protein
VLTQPPAALIAGSIMSRIVRGALSVVDIDETPWERE